MSLTSGSIHIWFSIQKEHCEIKNEDSKKITIRAIGDARVLVNGEPVDDDEEEELHHLDRYFLGGGCCHTIFYIVFKIRGGHIVVLLLVGLKC